MGLIYADIELANAKNGALKSIVVKALVDTGAMTLCIPEHIAIQLELQEIEKREVTRADERPHPVPYVGPVQIKFANRTCFKWRSGDRRVRTNGCCSDGRHGSGCFSNRYDHPLHIF